MICPTDAVSARGGAWGRQNACAVVGAQHVCVFHASNDEMADHAAPLTMATVWRSRELVMARVSSEPVGPGDGRDRARAA
jgi:hypothetical protein